MTVSAKGENGLEEGTPGLNPITLEGQIQEFRMDGDYVILRLYRQPYEFVAVKWLCVEGADGKRVMYARELQERDHIHLDGDLDHKTIHANRIVLLRREQHIGAN